MNSVGWGVGQLVPNVKWYPLFFGQVVPNMKSSGTQYEVKWYPPRNIKIVKWYAPRNIKYFVNIVNHEFECEL